MREESDDSPVSRPFPFLPSGALFYLSAILAAVLLEALLLAGIPVVAGWVLDHGFKTTDKPGLWNTLLLLGNGVVAALAAGFLRDYLLSKFHAKTIAHVRQNMFEAMQSIPVDAPVGQEPLESVSSAVIDRFANDLASIDESLAMAVPWGVLPLLESLLCTILMLGLNWRLGVFILPLWPWILLASRRFAYRAALAGEDAAQTEEKLLGTVEETWSAQWLIRAFCMEETRARKFRGGNEGLARRTAKAGWLAALLERFTGGGLLAAQLAILVAGASLLSTGRATPGTLASELLLAVLLGNSLQYMAEYLPALANTLRAWSRIKEGFAGDSVCPPDAPDARHLPPLQQEIVAADVSYGQPDTLPELEAVSFSIRLGEHVAFVGPSGSGKSCMLRLLMRLQNPTAGRITFDGHDLQAVTAASLRAQIGFVPQHCHIFDGTVRENIQMGRTSFSPEALQSAARLAGLNLDPNSEHFPGGLETKLGEGGRRVSLESAQRLSLARALVGDPKILLLDEVCSSLEPLEEEALNRTLAHVVRGRTVVSVTHRLASVAWADRIYLFDRGGVLEHGSHFELLALRGAYSDLWRKQAGFRVSADGRHVDVDAQRLKQLPFLERLDKGLLTELAPFFATETFPAGRDIVCQNDHGDKFYIIVRGRVDVWRTEEHSGRTLRVASLNDGDYFGEITLITGFPRTATVRTVTPSTFLSIERGQFTRLMEGFPELRRELSEVAVQRLRSSSQAVADSRR